MNARLPWQVSSLEHARALSWDLARKHIAAFHIRTLPAAEEHLHNLEELPGFLLEEPAIGEVSLHFWAIGQSGSIGLQGQVGKPMLLSKGLARVRWLKLKTLSKGIHVMIPGAVDWRLLRLDSAECLEMVFRNGSEDPADCKQKHARQNKHNSSVGGSGAVCGEIESMGPEAVPRHHLLSSHTDRSPGVHACMLRLLSTPQ